MTGAQGVCEVDLVLISLVLLVAVLYSSVGHGGASGYLAVMALAGTASATMKPTALILNVLVAGVGSARYLAQTCFRWSAFWPFALGSIPFAFLGGSTQSPEEVYRKLLGVILVLAGGSMVVPRPKHDAADVSRDLPIPAGVGLGIAIGYVSGLIGVGGGIFLSPILILMRWATVRETLGISALFILVNSLAGLAGQAARLSGLPTNTLALAAAAFVGGCIGTELGAKRLSPPWLRRTLSLVLAIAAAKLLLT